MTESGTFYFIFIWHINYIELTHGLKKSLLQNRRILFCSPVDMVHLLSKFFRWGMGSFRPACVQFITHFEFLKSRLIICYCICHHPKCLLKLQLSMTTAIYQQLNITLMYDLIKFFFLLLLTLIFCFYFLKTFYISFSVLTLCIQILTAFGKHMCHSLPSFGFIHGICFSSMCTH